MQTIRRAHTPTSSGRLVWLLWLALLLPVAQLAASWHGLSHTGLLISVGASADVRSGSSSDFDHKRTAHPTHCDLCLTAAAISGVAPFVAPQTLLRVAASHEVPPAPVVHAWQALFTPAYRSRAPPVTTL